MAVTKDFPSGSAAAPAGRSSSCPSPICSSPSCSQAQTPSQAVQAAAKESVGPAPAQAAAQESLGPAPAQAAAQESLGPAPVPSRSSPGGPHSGAQSTAGVSTTYNVSTLHIACLTLYTYWIHRTAQYTYIADLTLQSDLINQYQRFL